MRRVGAFLLSLLSVVLAVVVAEPNVSLLSVVGADFMRRARAFLFSLLSVVLSVVVAEPNVSASGGAREPPDPGWRIQVDPHGVTILVVEHGWHTAIVVRRSDVDRTIWPDADEFSEASLIEIGWGDREFYMADRGSAWLAVKAAFFTSGSVLHVVGLRADDETIAGVDVVQLRLSRRGFDAMTRFVSDEYQRDERNHPIRLGPGLYRPSFFYAARSRYHLFNTCNTWGLRALRAAGLDVTPAGTVVAGDVMREVRRVAGREPRQS